MVPQVLEDFLEVSIVGDLHSVESQPCPSDVRMSSPRSSFLVLAELADSPLRSTFLVLEDGVSSCRRS